MTPTAAQILEMIETVDPNDTDKLDEIDHRVFCFVENEEYIPRESTEKLTVEKLLFAKMILTHGYEFGLPKYTRSRDQLKKIRPEGWTFSMLHQSAYVAVSNQHIKRIHVDDCGNQYDELVQLGSPSPSLPKKAPKTEELAELHAIIQAIDFERTKK